ncbi:MAG TPA: hypothetical protein VM536_05520 [Chloroflexia bacterium]|nr:hypothetical protein [Chloroflexia bacterium]
MSEEQMRILKMIEEKKISAEDGAKLLGALTSATAARARSEQNARGERRRWNTGGWAWGGPEPPIPPIPPMPPMPPRGPGFGFDPFEMAFGQGGRAAREEGRAAREEARVAREEARGGRRGRRDTEPLESLRREAAGRHFRVLVTDSTNGHTMVNVNLPLGLINFGLRLAARYLPENSDFNLQELSNAIQQGATGKIFEVEQGAKDGPGVRVEISVDP